MKIGMIGLGKMGINLVKNLRRNDIDVVGFDLNSNIKDEVLKTGSTFVSSIEDMVSNLEKPRIIWVMVPSGDATNNTVNNLIEYLEKDDIIIDGGNSYFKDSIKLNEDCSKKGIYFLDCGSSGGQSGALNGGNFMIGGDSEAFKIVESIFEKISEKDGYLYTGESGSGHYLKMVHNGIEYGMMQAIGEGFDLLDHSPYKYDNEKVAKMWNHGSVIRGWLMELCQSAFLKDPCLSKIKGKMFSSGEGRWTVEEALKQQVAIPIIATSLLMRYRSLEDDTFSGKVVAALRHEFGGHATESK